MFLKDLFYRFKQNWLKLLSAALTIIWIFVLLFPLYWLLVSSTKDASEAMRNPPRLGIVLPKDYTIYLDTTDAEDYDEEDFQYEALVLQWMLSARNFSINLNSVTVARVENDKVISTATLNYATYREVEEDIFVGSVAETLIMNWRVNGSKKYQTMLSIMEEDGYATGLDQTPNLDMTSENIKTINRHFDEVMDLLEHANTQKIDAIASLPPSLCSYYGHQDTISYYKALAKASKYPVYAYVTPVTMQHSELYSFAKELSEIENIAGLKITIPDYFKFALVNQIYGGRLNNLNGPDEMLLCGVSVGADGGIGTTYNIVPKLPVKIYESFKKRQYENRACVPKQVKCFY